MLYSTHIHWGKGNTICYDLYLFMGRFSGLNDGSEHQIETTQYGGEFQFYHYKAEYGDPQEASKHKVSNNNTMVVS